MAVKKFKDLVLDAVRAIPAGKVKTYGQVANDAGCPGAARAVGTLMKNNYLDDVPCHRVVKSNGEVGDYNRGGPAEKFQILICEGVRFVGKRVQF
jgi:methylated-DNA-[protein]-cysteine S-methyltransferase